MEALTIIAAVLGIVGISVVSTARYLRSRAIVVPRHQPAKPVRSGDISFLDVQAGLVTLTSDARSFGPDLIVGINRGGAIMSGLIAKQLDTFAILLVEVNCDLPAAKRVTTHGGQLPARPQKILLVDDAKRKGEHMREVFSWLHSQFPSAIVRRAVMLELVNNLHSGPEQEVFRNNAAEMAAFRTTNASVKLPWDRP